VQRVDAVALPKVQRVEYLFSRGLQVDIWNDEIGRIEDTRKRSYRYWIWQNEHIYIY
jgi:hypothetical protein